MADKQHKKQLPEALAKNKWKPGQSGNPNGRPKKDMCIPDILKAIGKEEGTKDGDYTKLDVVLRKVFQYALEGKSWAVQFIADRMEGKPAQTNINVEQELDEVIIE